MTNSGLARKRGLAISVIGGQLQQQHLLRDIVDGRSVSINCGLREGCVDSMRKNAIENSAKPGRAPYSYQY